MKILIQFFSLHYKSDINLEKNNNSVSSYEITAMFNYN